MLYLQRAAPMSTSDNQYNIIIDSVVLLTWQTAASADSENRCWQVDFIYSSFDIMTKK